MNLKAEDDTVVCYIVLLNGNISASGMFSVDQSWEQTGLSLLAEWQAEHQGCQALEVYFNILWYTAQNRKSTSSGSEGFSCYKQTNLLVCRDFL